MTIVVKNMVADDSSGASLYTSGKIDKKTICKIFTKRAMVPQKKQ